MISLNIRTEGLESIVQALQEVPEAMQSGMRQAAETLRFMAEGATPEGDPNRPGRQRGHAKRSWGQIEEHSSGYSFSNPVPYTTVLEEGLYPRAGPRTVESGGKVYSRQAVGGILAPLLQDRQTLEQVLTLIANEIIRGIQQHART